jgi:glycosyltransferase involved in cell wall biosynthesis
MKVLLLSRKWPPAIGGMELYCWELSRHLKNSQAVDLDLYVLPGNQNGTAPGLWKLAFFVLRTSMFLLLKRPDHDVIHFGDFVLFPLAWLDSLIRKRRSRVLTIYGLDLAFSRKIGILPMIYRQFIGWAIHRQDAVSRYIAISRFTQKLALSYGLREVEVVPLGIKTTESQDCEGVLSRAQHEFDERYVFYLGRIVSRKGVIWFADNVLPRLPENIEFFVAGRFYRVEDKEHLKSLGRVKVLGQIDNESAANFRRKALAVVMPNIPIENSADVEGFGLAALEVPAQGGILIASMLEGIEDAVIDGVTGFATKPGDVDDWVEKLNVVMRWAPEQRSEFIKRAHEVIKERYSWERVADETINVYFDTLRS